VLTTHGISDAVGVITTTTTAAAAACCLPQAAANDPAGSNAADQITPVSSVQDCLDFCDNLAACLAVYFSGTGCHRIDGDFATVGVVTSAIKAAPAHINTAITTVVS
jgi:hypothetical protein